MVIIIDNLFPNKAHLQLYILKMSDHQIWSIARKGYVVKKIYTYLKQNPAQHLKLDINKTPHNLNNIKDTK